jgi:predicted dehydrogenase
MTTTLGVAIVGYGYWGPNLLRTFSGNRRFKVVLVADARQSARERAAEAAPGVLVVEDALEAIRHPQVDLVAIATPVATHYPFARRALDAGKHVLVEKPLAASVAEAEDLIERASRAGRTLLVDHTFLFTEAVRKIASLVHDGALGDICYFDSMRVNLGLFQPDVNVLWDLAPHDLSIIDHLFDAEPIYVAASGYCHVNSGVPDLCYVTLHYPGNRVAHLNLSWMSPVKVRRIAIGGTKQMLIWDDLDHDEKLKIYNAGIEFHADDERPVIVPGYRIGDIFSPRLSKKEALVGVAEHVAAVIGGEERSIMDGARGLRIVRTLERIQAALDEDLDRARHPALRVVRTDAVHLDRGQDHAWTHATKAVG